MRYSEQIKPISYLKDNIARVVTEITQTREPMIITQNGEAAFVVQDIVSYQQNQETLVLLKLLAIGRQQINEGKFSPAESVFAEIDADPCENAADHS